MPWECSTTLDAGCDPQRAWELLADVAAWPAWHPGIASASLDGPLEAGTTGTSRAPGGPASRLEILSVDAPRALVSEARLPLVRVTFDWALEPHDGGTRISHSARIHGPAAPVFRRTIGPRLRRSVPAAVSALAEHAA